MAKIAVDIVLLPSESMMDTAIEANRRLIGPVRAEIILNKETCLPHLSLAMGCLEDSCLDKAGEILSRIAGRGVPGRLKVTGIYVGTNSAGEKVSAFGIEPTAELRALHEEVMLGFAGCLSYDVKADMLPGPAPSESTLRWIRNFRTESSFSRFLPHITIGYGEIRDFPCPAEFAPSKLALCRLANHCTCVKVLASASL
ncbi:MAG: hypothetical protein JW720_11610 [Sedimentisphaerales bacterium]|nr:hypothetical protein [Sedimentisphaerales bacterium]